MIEFREAVLAGLRRADKRIPCKYLYDEVGSRLFDRISQLPEYYLTRTELALLRRHARDIAAQAGPRCRVVEFGAGSSRKIRLLLDALDRPAVYVPVDVSRDYLMMQAARLGHDHPGLEILPVCADFLGDISLPPGSGHRRTLGFFPGSTIGNLDPDQARAFLARAARLVGGDGLMVVGVDLRKPVEILHPAYDDSQGVTAAFSLNLLARINRELGGSFDLSGFHHSARWDERRGCVAIHLVSLRRQDAKVAGITLRFEEGERIHIEDSYKYTVEGFRALAASAGFVADTAWTDADRLFSLHCLRPQ